MRPRPSTLGWIAGAIDPDRRKEIRDQLVEAAGDEIAPHSEAWSRRQVYRVNQRLPQGLVPRPVAWDRQMRLTAASDAMVNVAMVLTDKAAAMLDRPGADRLVDELINLTGAAASGVGAAGQGRRSALSWYSDAQVAWRSGRCLAVSAAAERPASCLAVAVGVAGT